MNSEILETEQPILFKESRLQEVCEQPSLGEFRRKTGYERPEKQKCTVLNIKEEKISPFKIRLIYPKRFAPSLQFLLDF